MLFLFGVVWHPEINSASSDKSEASRPLEMKNNSFKKIDQKKNHSVENVRPKSSAWGESWKMKKRSGREGAQRFQAAGQPILKQD